MKFAPEPLAAAAFAPFGQVMAAIGAGPAREPQPVTVVPQGRA